MTAMGAAELVDDIREHYVGSIGYESSGVVTWDKSNTEAIALVEQRDTALNAELQARCDRLAAQVTDTRNSAIKAFAEILRLGDSHRTRSDREYVDRELVIDILMRMKREVYALRAGKEGSHDEG